MGSKGPPGPPGRALQHRITMNDVYDAYKVKSDHEAVARAPRYIIRPDSRRMVTWDLFTSVALIFTTLVTPYEVAFLESSPPGLYATNRLIDGIFIADMVLQFFLMYKIERVESPEKEGADAGTGTMWEYRLSRIALQYLRTWLLVDIVSIFPSAFDVIEGGSDISDVKVLRVLRAARLVKLVRLVRSSRLLRRWRTRISLSYASVTIVSLSLQLVVVTHWLACFLALQTIFGPGERSAAVAASVQRLERSASRADLAPISPSARSRDGDSDGALAWRDAGGDAARCTPVVRRDSFFREVHGVDGTGVGERHGEKDAPTSAAVVRQKSRPRKLVKQPTVSSPGCQGRAGVRGRQMASGVAAETALEALPPSPASARALPTDPTPTSPARRRSVAFAAVGADGVRTRGGAVASVDDLPPAPGYLEC